MSLEIVKKIVRLPVRRFRELKENFLRERLRKRVLEKKKLLNSEKENYLSYNDITFIIQSFNKDENIRKILLELLNIGASNIILIDDGSIDRTLNFASNLLTGENHVILRSNDVHEVINYRRTIMMSETKYICLMQDDDIPVDTPSWIDNSIEILETFAPKLIVLGLRDGFDFTWMSEETDEKEDTPFYSEGDSMRLEGVFEAKLVKPTPTKLLNDKLVDFNFCQIVNRAPTFIRRKEFLETGGIGIQFKPYQYDDVDYCLRAWENGFWVGITSSNFSRNVGIGGMRLFNSIKSNSKPKHFTKNWSNIRRSFSILVNNEQLQKKVIDARSAISDQQDIL